MKATNRTRIRPVMLVKVAQEKDSDERTSPLDCREYFG